jgi:anti-sigma factor RsiW
MNSTHLTSGQFVRALDDELAPAESVAVESHLDSCEGCRLKLRDLGALSANMEDALLGPVPLRAESPLERDELVTLMYACEHLSARKSSRFWYSGLTAAALAAGLALVLLAPSLTRKQSMLGAAASTGTLQVDGETFIALPYSNRALSSIGARIVEMQVPAASLIDAGVVFEPVSSAASDPDRSVHADVLLGADGEPLGVHVLGQQ